MSKIQKCHVFTSESVSEGHMDVYKEWASEYETDYLQEENINSKMCTYRMLD